LCNLLATQIKKQMNLINQIPKPNSDSVFLSLSLSVALILFERRTDFKKWLRTNQTQINTDRQEEEE
jgi:hypothetical protein